MSDQPSEPSVPSSSWHSIRPWTPHLILTVREITSVSATFILSSSLSTPAEDISSPIAEDTSEHEQHDLEPPIDATDSEAPDSTLDATSRGIIADALSGSKGLSVSVNGSLWQRVLIRLHDHLDEAIIIIYGLMPGRQYDIDLSLVQGGQASSIRRQVITEEAEGSADNVRMDEGTSTCFLLPSSPSSSSTPSSIEPTPMLPSQPQTPRSTTPPQEDCLPPLQSQLSSLQAQITNLAATLKSTRRDSQKADAALKSEIEALNRASEKASVAEAKARQRIRALEDAARRANEGKEEVDHVRSELESEVPDLRKQVREREEECEALRKEAGKVRREREAKEEVRRRRIEGVKADIGSTEHRLERLSGRQEKLEGTALPDLEKTLKEIEKEIEEVESSLSVDGLGGQYPAPISRPTQIPPISPPQHRRHQPHTPMTYRIGQDGVPPGLGLSNPYVGSTLSHATSSAFPHPTSSSLSHSKISTLSHPTSPVPSHAGAGSSTASTLGMSILSSKAVPFEPTRSFRSSFPPLSPPPAIAPIQRPIGTGAFQRVGRSLPNGAADEGTRAI